MMGLGLEVIWTTAIFPVWARPKQKQTRNSIPMTFDQGGTSVTWFMIEGFFPRDMRRIDKAFLTLSARQPPESGHSIEHILPILYNGKVSEIVDLPPDLADLSWRSTSGEIIALQDCSIRRLGWFERLWRMAYRVARAFFDFPAGASRMMGNTLAKALFDLTGAYRAATLFRFSWPLSHYNDWLARVHVLTDADRNAIRQQIEKLTSKPYFLVLIPTTGTEKSSLDATLASLSAQLYQNFSVYLPDDPATIEARRLPESHDYWVLSLLPGDRLAEHALFWFAYEALARPEAVAIYSDDDALDRNGVRCRPRFKPDWSLAHLRATNYIGNAVVLRGSAVEAAGGLRLANCRHGQYGLLLRMVEQAMDRVAHIPAVLVHRGEIHSHPNPSPEENGSLADAQRESLNAEEMAAVRAHLKRCGVAAVVEPTRPGCWRVRYRLPEQPPLVSIIVPTRDKPALIRQCVESLRTKTTYPRYEILVVDNQSTNLESLAYLTALAGQETVRVLRYDYPFNYSAINNFAAREARGEVLCLLNNDTKIISEDWLEEMVGHLLQPKVGVVGAKLYFPDGRVQHAGDTVGPGGCANHLHAFIERDDPGYCNRAAVAQELSAVTAACLVTWKNIYQRMGGLEEKHLPVTFNDVDYCLRVREAGYRIVWTPHAELYHHEFESRGKDKSPEKAHRARREVAHMRKRWKHVMRHDPFYNPNLGYQRPDFLLSNAPMVERPWLT